MGPLVLALVAALPARDVDVTWRGDPRCREDGFQDSLARYLERSTAARPVRVAVEVRRDRDGRWSATLELASEEGRGTRRLHGRSCAEVRDAAAFVTAVVVDPGALAPRDEPAIVPAPGEAGAPGAEGGDMSRETSGGPAADLSAETDPGPAADLPGQAAPGPAPDLSGGTAPPPERGDAPLDPLEPAVGEAAPAENAPEDMSPKTSAPAYPRGFVRLAGGLEALGMPRVGPQAALAGGVLGRRWRVELTAIYRAPTIERSPVDPAAGARVRLWAVGARGCGVLRARSVEFPLCGGLEAGQAIGEGIGFEGGRADRIAWVAAVLGPAVAWAPRPWLALWLGADLGVPLLGGTFSAAGLGPMFEIAPVSLRAAAGLELRFGRRNSG